MSIDHQEFKIVLSGPFGAGKTTLIHAISNTPVVGTEVGTVGDEAALKDTTTVGMEYGCLEFVEDDIDVKLRLYGTPGQERFGFMWEILSVGADACILIVDVSRPETWEEAERLAHFFGAREFRAFAVFANRAADAPEQLAELAAQLAMGPNVPVIPCDISNTTSARVAVVTVLELLLSDPASADIELEMVGDTAWP